MPIQPCTINGKSGFRAGPTGKCFRSKKDALRQLAAIEISKSKSTQEIFDELSHEELELILSDITIDPMIRLSLANLKETKL